MRTRSRRLAPPRWVVDFLRLPFGPGIPSSARSSTRFARKAPLSHSRTIAFASRPLAAGECFGDVEFVRPAVAAPFALVRERAPSWATTVRLLATMGNRVVGVSNDARFRRAMRPLAPALGVRPFVVQGGAVVDVEVHICIVPKAVVSKVRWPT